MYKCGLDDCLMCILFIDGSHLEFKMAAAIGLFQLRIHTEITLYILIQHCVKFQAFYHKKNAQFLYFVSQICPTSCAS